MKFSPPLTACPAFIKHRSSVLSAAAAILFCPPLAAAEPSAAGDPVQAVHDAHAVELPDWHQTLKNPSSIVGSVAAEASRSLKVKSPIGRTVRGIFTHRRSRVPSAAVKLLTPSVWPFKCLTAGFPNALPFPTRFSPDVTRLSGVLNPAAAVQVLSPAVTL